MADDHLMNVGTAVRGGAGLLLLAASPALVGCVGAGDTARVLGRVTSTSATQVCVAPVGGANGYKICRLVPEGATDIPSVGECVWLAETGEDTGNTKLWDAKSLAEHISESDCERSPSP
jgi:hypothetical protein